MSKPTLREQYELANQFRKMPFAERPYFGSPGAPAQAETNTSSLWAHLNSGYLFAYEYTRWWKESQALRKTAILGDWSWLNKVRLKGPDAEKLLNYASVKDISKQQVGQIMYTPMCDENGKVAIEGLTWKIADDEYIFTQSGALHWLNSVQSKTPYKVDMQDVTPDYTCFALQGPTSTEILEAVTGESFQEMKFSRWRKIKVAGIETLVGRQGVTGEVGYEFMARTDGGNAHEVWRAIRNAGKDFGIRELGFKAQMVGHTETGIATVVRDFFPARMSLESAPKFARLWMSPEELDAVDYSFAEHFCSPAELGWAHTINLDNHDFIGHGALAKERDAGGPARKLVGLLWNSDDMAALYADLFKDGNSAPPPDLPYGQFRMHYMKTFMDDARVGWATGACYSPTLRRMISMCRIDKALIEPGNQVQVEWGGFSDEPKRMIRAEVVKLPFIKQERTKNLTAS